MEGEFIHPAYVERSVLGSLVPVGVPVGAMPLSPLAFTALLSTGDEFPADGDATFHPPLKYISLEFHEPVLKVLPLTLKEGDGFGHPGALVEPF